MMRTTWKKVITNVVVGGAVGAVDQLIQNTDNRRGYEQNVKDPTKLDKNGKLPFLKQFGTLYNYGVPLVALGATVMGMIPEEWSDRAVLVGAQLAGRKATETMSTRMATAPAGQGSYAWTQWRREAAAGANANRQKYEVQNQQEILV